MSIIYSILVAVFQVGALTGVLYMYTMFVKRRSTLELSRVALEMADTLTDSQNKKIEELTQEKEAIMEELEAANAEAEEALKNQKTPRKKAAKAKKK